LLIERRGPRQRSAAIGSGPRHAAKLAHARPSGRARGGAAAPGAADDAVAAVWRTAGDGARGARPLAVARRRRARLEGVVVAAGRRAAGPHRRGEAGTRVRPGTGAAPPCARLRTAHPAGAEAARALRRQGADLPALLEGGRMVDGQV